jgi:hypothetical protein
LLCDRIATVRADLIEIAALLDATEYPDCASIAALHALLSNGCESPLYNREVHISELRATLYYVRRQLRSEAATRLTS